MIPDAIIESGKIDGAGEFGIFFRLVIPLALPGLATIALFSTLGYWNDWFNALLYIENPESGSAAIDADADREQHAVHFGQQQQRLPG